MTGSGRGWQGASAAFVVLVVLACGGSAAAEKVDIRHAQQLRAASRSRGGQSDEALAAEIERLTGTLMRQERLRQRGRAPALQPASHYRQPPRQQQPVGGAEGVFSLLQSAEVGPGSHDIEPVVAPAEPSGESATVAALDRKLKRAKEQAQMWKTLSEQLRSTAGTETVREKEQFATLHQELLAARAEAATNKEAAQHAEQSEHEALVREVQDEERIKLQQQRIVAKKVRELEQQAEASRRQESDANSAELAALRSELAFQQQRADNATAAAAAEGGEASRLRHTAQRAKAGLAHLVADNAASEEDRRAAAQARGMLGAWGDAAARVVHFLGPAEAAAQPANATSGGMRFRAGAAGADGQIDATSFLLKVRTVLAKHDKQVYLQGVTAERAFQKERKEKERNQLRADAYSPSSFLGNSRYSLPAFGSAAAARGPDLGGLATSNLGMRTTSVLADEAAEVQQALSDLRHPDPMI